ncbi:MAG: hypothetical protein ACI8W1_000088 [Candidatus Azotimanducaceae bacterium]|jgi:hypothetical protein
MLKLFIFMGAIFSSLNSSANVLYFTKDMTEDLYLLEILFQPSSSKWLESSSTKTGSAGQKNEAKNKRFQPPRSLLEELISKQTQLDTITDDVMDINTTVELVITEEAMDPFFDIGFGRAKIEVNSAEFGADENSDIISGLDVRGIIETQLSGNDLVKQTAIDLREFYQVTDFSSINIKFGGYSDNFSIQHGNITASSQIMLRSLAPQQRENKNSVENSASGRFINFIPSFLFSGTFWLITYLTLCLAIFARSMLKRR